MSEEGRPIQMNHRVDVDGTVYDIMLFAPTRALKLQIRLARIIGAPMAEMVKVSMGADVGNILPQAVSLLMQKMDDTDEVVSLIKELMACVTKEKKMLDFDTEFRGRLGTMVLLLKKVIEIQFEDFMRALSASFQGVKEELEA